jgi:hypothetical protein
MQLLDGKVGIKAGFLQVPVTIKPKCSLDQDIIRVERFRIIHTWGLLI